MFSFLIESNILFLYKSKYTSIYNIKAYIHTEYRIVLSFYQKESIYSDANKNQFFFFILFALLPRKAVKKVSTKVKQKTISLQESQLESKKN